MRIVETPQEYIARMLALAEGDDPLAVLGSTAGLLAGLLESTPEERWHRRASPDRWSAAEILAHLADVEIVTGWRMRAILATDGSPLQPFDQNVWAEAFKYSDVDLRGALGTFSAVRASLLSLLGRVDPARLEHHGMHGERGKETVGHLLRLYAGHDRNHLRQIEELVG